MLTAEVPDPTGYGRIVRDERRVGRRASSSTRTPTDEQRAIREINSGVFAFDAAAAAGRAWPGATDNSQGEEYLTDVLGILRDGHRVGAVAVERPPRDRRASTTACSWPGRAACSTRRTVEAWMRAGVTVVDPATTWVDVDVTFEPDALVHPGTQLPGRTTVAEGAEVGPNSRLNDTRVGAGAEVDKTAADGAVIGAEATVGPYAYLRPGTRLGAKAKAGGTWR